MVVISLGNSDSRRLRITNQQSSLNFWCAQNLLILHTCFCYMWPSIRVQSANYWSVTTEPIISQLPYHKTYLKPNCEVQNVFSAGFSFSVMKCCVVEWVVSTTPSKHWELLAHQEEIFFIWLLKVKAVHPFRLLATALTWVLSYTAVMHPDPTSI